MGKRKRPLPTEGPPDVAQEEITQVLRSGSAVPAAASFNGAKLTLELLESSTTQLVRRLGWFRDVRLRRAADSFMKSSKLHQQATSRLESEGAFPKPSQEQLQAFEEELKQHIEKLQQ